MNVMEKLTRQLKQSWEAVVKDGAFVFDIDETLLPPDENLRAYPDLTAKLTDLLCQGLSVVLISGGPGAVVEDRIILPLKDSMTKSYKPLSGLTNYVNGGSTKYTIQSDGLYLEDTVFSAKNQIPASYVKQVKERIEAYLKSEFELNQEEFTNIVQIWIKKRSEQWRDCHVTFNDTWILGKPWTMEYWEDDEMAAIKAKRKSGEATFPFVNTRRVKRNAAGEMEGLAGFTPSGFYSLSKARGDNLDLDLRDFIMDRLQKDLGQTAEELVMRKAGRSSIDITKKGTDKAAALKDFISSSSRKPEHIYYFGDEFHQGGNDQPLAEDAELKKSGIHLLSLHRDSAPENSHVTWLGKGLESVHKLLFQLPSADK